MEISCSGNCVVVELSPTEKFEEFHINRAVWFIDDLAAGQKVQQMSHGPRRYAFLVQYLCCKVAFTESSGGYLINTQVQRNFPQTSQLYQL